MKNNRIKYCALALSVFAFTSCGVYKEYKSDVSVSETAYGEINADTTSNMAAVGWKTMFVDPQLQTLISNALSKNTSVKTAAMRLEQAEIGYKTARLGYLPTLAFSPSVSFDQIYGEYSQYANLGIAASWQLDVFGAGITNTKRKSKANIEYMHDYEQATKCRIISSVAQLYYQLVGLDQKLVIMRNIEAIYNKTYESVQTLFEVGAYESPAIHQTKAQLEELRVSVINIENAIETIEHSICQILNEPYHHISRNSTAAITMPEAVSIGVPADMLRYRPDVRAAERKIELAYYDVLLAKGALYPNITITADGGWMSNPAGWIVSGAASLLQPIFQGGKLRANVKTSKIEQQILMDEFTQTMTDASHEVTSSLRACQYAKAKQPHITEQVKALREAVDATQELMNNGTTSYIEVLTALQSLLQAQISETDNNIEGALAVVKLYAALGGGHNE